MTAAALGRRGAAHHCSGAHSWRPAAAPLSSSPLAAACVDPIALRSRTWDEDHPAVAARRRRDRRRQARRRRILLGSVVTGIVVALALPWGGVGRPPLATPGPVLAGATVAPHSVYVVQTGDTLWSIAERLRPGGDPRPVVTALEAQAGSDTVHPGEQLRLP